MQVRTVRLVLRGSGLVTACVLVLVACVTTLAPPAPPPGYDELVAMARQSAEAGHTDLALESYRRAAEADPARKEPWQEMSRMNFAAGRPVRALMAAEEALQRDPSDVIANQVYIDCAMQVARQAMQRLRAAGAKPDDDALVLAQQLVATMGLVFGDDALVRDEVKARYARRAVQQYRDAQARQSQSQPAEEKSKPRPDPLEILGGD